jgi:hypothetical protein
VLAQAAAVDQVVDHFGQRQIPRLAAQGFDQPDEFRDRVPGLAGQARGGVVEARIGRMRRFLQRLDAARADPARRKIDHPRKGRVVVGIGDQAQVGKRMLDLLPIEEAQAAMHAVRHALP